jgi:glucose uptake protein GlcU
MMVPFKLASAHAPADLSSIASAFSYAVSFGACVCALSFVLLGIRVCYGYMSGAIVSLHFKEAFPAAAVQACHTHIDAHLHQGTLWNLGNVASLLAVLSPLGMTVAYPLCQLSLLVACVWGITLFGELAGRKAIACFFCGVLVTCAGAVLLGLYGACQA